MNALELISLSCPYCGETIELTIDSSHAGQHYIEDCQVCCRPIEVHVVLEHAAGMQVTVRREDE